MSNKHYDDWVKWPRKRLLLVVSYLPLSWLFLLPVLVLSYLVSDSEVSSYLIIGLGVFALASQFVLPPLVIGWFSKDKAFLNGLVGYLIYVVSNLLFLNAWFPRESWLFSSEAENKMLYLLALLILGVIVGLVSYASSFIKRGFVLD
jgi:hypothetical protein